MDQDSTDAAKGLEILRALTGSGGRVGGDSNINVSLQGANSVLLVISAACCAVMLVLAIFGALWVMDDRAEVRAQLRERRDGENAIRAYINNGAVDRIQQREKANAE